MVKYFLFGGVALASAALGYGVSELTATPVPLPLPLPLPVAVSPAPVAAPVYSPQQVARVAAKASLSRIMEPAQGDGFMAVCETPRGECTVGPQPINSGCYCGETPGRITR
ncbi:hypothetical protein [Pseudoruegeria sp. SK021]|uniref:hypothetical protein n=1 Tax=Pseudoruegeria sp. SK021 TaxID=1933035 RepID=UPI000A217E37|nr:hypothetical protein [Pseudoruegeria sp. SK021]OSP55481.1 hypothetical protein BV911_07495 [Pseudoruegeria sp. SK021]